MSRRKTRVTRTSRRKARSGTRKQKGGGFFEFFNPRRWFEKNPATNTGDPATNPAKPNGPAPAAPPPGGAPAPDAPPGGALPDAPGQGGGARKTRHRRRHHRK